MPIHSWWSHLEDRLYETRLGIETRGVMTPTEADSSGYSTVGYSGVAHVLAHLDLRSEDVFVDLGCGKGRVICMASRRPLRRVVGVEMRPELCELAMVNAKRTRGASTTVEVVCASVLDVDDAVYDAWTALYLFNPFGEATLVGVLERLRRSLARVPRRLRIAYVFPVHERLLRFSGFLRQLRRIAPRPLRGLNHEVSVWES